MILVGNTPFSSPKPKDYNVIKTIIKDHRMTLLASTITTFAEIVSSKLHLESYFILLVKAKKSVQHTA